ncbi:MAG TPA: hypothetical protein DIC52_00515 [Candidatus Latescibacteria bacterium]|nr:hypothetical protein [Candidatus Latescibacterota bacterium]
MESGALAYVQPDLCHCGGFWEGRKIASMAEVYGACVMPHNPNDPISTSTRMCCGSFRRRPTDHVRRHQDNHPRRRRHPGLVNIT